MRKVEDYKKHAQECRTMARNTTNEEQRRGLLQMAETWEGLARDRIVQMARHQRIGALDQPLAEMGRASLAISNSTHQDPCRNRQDNNRQTDDGHDHGALVAQRS